MQGEQTPLTVAELSGSVKMKNVLTSKKVVYVNFLEAEFRSLAESGNVQTLVRASNSLERFWAIDGAMYNVVLDNIFTLLVVAGKRNVTQAEFQLAVCSALVSLAKGDAAVKKAVAAGAIEAVAAAMTAHPRSAEVHAAAVYFIKAVWPGENRLSSYWWHHSYNSAEYTNVVPKLQAIPIDTIIRTFPNGPAIEVKAYAYFRDGAMKRFWPSA